MQLEKCIKFIIVMCYLSLEQYLSFDYLLWQITFKTKCLSSKRGLCHII